MDTTVVVINLAAKHSDLSFSENPCNANIGGCGRVGIGSRTEWKTIAALTDRPGRRPLASATRAYSRDQPESSLLKLQ